MRRIAHGADDRRRGNRRPIVKGHAVDVDACEPASKDHLDTRLAELSRRVDAQPLAELGQHVRATVHEHYSRLDA